METTKSGLRQTRSGSKRTFRILRPPSLLAQGALLPRCPSVRDRAHPVLPGVTIRPAGPSWCPYRCSSASKSRRFATVDAVGEAFVAYLFGRRLRRIAGVVLIVLGAVVAFAAN